LTRHSLLIPLLESAWRGKAQVGILSGNFAPAIAACMKALEQDPASEVAIHAAWRLLREAGRHRKRSRHHYDRALAIKPEYEDAITRKIFTLDFAPDADFAVHQAARRAWWDTIGVKIPAKRTAAFNTGSEQADCCRLCFLRFSEFIRRRSLSRPVLRNHDRQAFEVIC